MIIEIEYKEIEDIWKRHLWPNRYSKIESISAMLFLKGYDLGNYYFKPTFFGFKIGDIIAGVNSGHKCADHSYRSRGLYVFPEYRKHGIAKDLLLATIDQAKKEYATFVWSYPRQESWNVYESAGFSLASDWHVGETGTNAYCKVVLQ